MRNAVYISLSVYMSGKLFVYTNRRYSQLCRRLAGNVCARENPSAASLIRGLDASPFNPKFSFEKTRIPSVDRPREKVGRQPGAGSCLPFQMEMMATI